MNHNNSPHPSYVSEKANTDVGFLDYSTDPGDPSRSSADSGINSSYDFQQTYHHSNEQIIAGGGGFSQISDQNMTSHHLDMSDVENQAYPGYHHENVCRYGRMNFTIDCIVYSYQGETRPPCIQLSMLYLSYISLFSKSQTCSSSKGTSRSK